MYLNFYDMEDDSVICNGDFDAEVPRDRDEIKIRGKVYRVNKVVLWVDEYALQNAYYDVGVVKQRWMN